MYVYTGCNVVSHKMKTKQNKTKQKTTTITTNQKQKTKRVHIKYGLSCVSEYFVFKSKSLQQLDKSLKKLFLQN